MAAFVDRVVVHVAAGKIRDELTKRAAVHA